MAQWWNGILDWLDSRLGVSQSVMPVLTHPIPKSSAGRMGWWYVFGSASLTLLMIQIVTGIGLALVYVPAADRAYESLLFLDYEQPLGWFLRALHYYAGSAMVVMVLIHMTQVFLHGSYKFPREMTWVVGVVLLVCTLGMFFTGQVLRWDPDAYWGLAVAGSMAGRVPGIGPELVEMLLGGPVIGGSSLSRFFSLHVFVIPGLLLLSLALHLWLVLRHGISEAPEAGRKIDPSTYEVEYQREIHTRGVPFLGEAAVRDGLFSALVVIAVLLIAALLGPKGPTEPPDPTLGSANPRPEWPFLWLFALLALSPPETETFVILLLPVLLILGLMAVPFISNRGERAPSRRPVAVLSVIVIYTTLGILTYQGAMSKWSPKMTAWSADPIPVGMVKRSTPLELVGSIVFQNKNCRNCHALDGVGGERGPDLTEVGIRLTSDQLIDQVSNGTPGGGNMPAYGKQMLPSEMDALIEFLTHRRPEGQAAAEPANEWSAGSAP